MFNLTPPGLAVAGRARPEAGDVYFLLLAALSEGGDADKVASIVRACVCACVCIVCLRVCGVVFYLEFDDDGAVSSKFNSKKKTKKYECMDDTRFALLVVQIAHCKKQWRCE